MLPAPINVRLDSPPPKNLLRVFFDHVQGAVDYRTYLAGHSVVDLGIASARVQRGASVPIRVAAVDSTGVVGELSTPVWWTRPTRDVSEEKWGLSLITFPGLAAPMLTPAQATARLRGWADYLEARADLKITIDTYGWLTADAPIDDPKWGGSYDTDTNLWYGYGWPRIKPAGTAADMWTYVLHGVGTHGLGGGSILMGEMTGFVNRAAWLHEYGHCAFGDTHCGDLYLSNQSNQLAGPAILDDIRGQRLQGYGDHCAMGSPLDSSVGYCPFHAHQVGLVSHIRWAATGQTTIPDGGEVRVGAGMKSAWYAVGRSGNYLLIRYHLPYWALPGAGSGADIVTCGGPLAVGQTWTDRTGKLTIKHVQAGVAEIRRAA